jgi:hypothetical protein
MQQEQVLYNYHSFLTNSTDAQWDAYRRSSAAPWDANANLLAIEGWKDGESAAINFSYFSPYDSLWAPLESAIAQASKQKLNPQETEDYVLNFNVCRKTVPL